MAHRVVLFELRRARLDVHGGTATHPQNVTPNYALNTLQASRKRQHSRNGV